MAAKVHAAWMKNKRASGKFQGGEELMVTYEQLSEQAKDPDRARVRTVYEVLQTIAPSMLPFISHFSKPDQY